MSDEPTTRDYMLAQSGKTALATTISETAPPDKVIPICILAFSTALADVLDAAPAAAADINAQLAPAGWRVVPVR